MKSKNTMKTGIRMFVFITALLSGIGNISAQCSQFTTVADTFCTTDPSITLVGTPTPGTFFGTGVTGTSFDPSTAGAGSHIIGYTASSCLDTAFITMMVQLAPTITLNIPTTPTNQQNVCEFDAPYTISGNSPNPGWPTSWFTGSGVDTLLGTFSPSSTLLGWNVITFHYDDGVCSGTAVDSIEVMQNPTATISPSFPDTCASTSTFQLTQGFGTPSGGTGTYSGTGVSGSVSTGFFFSPATAGVGVHPITYCYTAPNGCETCVTQNLTIVQDPTVTFTQPPPPICENGPRVDLTPYGSPLGGYFTGPGITTDSIHFLPSSVGPGSYNVNYVYVDSIGCTNQASRSLAVSPKPIVNFQANSPLTTPDPPPDRGNILIKICEGDTAYSTATSSTGGDVESVQPSTFANVSFNTINFQPPSSQEFEVVMNLGGCRDTGTVMINVIPPATADIQGPEFVCLGDSVTLNVTGATSYTWINPAGQSGSPIVVYSDVSTIYQVVADSDVDGDGNLCSSDTGEIFIETKALPLVTTGNDTMLFYGDEAILKAYGAGSYVWSEGVTGELSCYQCDQPIVKPIFDLSEPDLRGYLVVGTDSVTGCMSEDSIYITLNDRIVLFVPTAFSPNGDGTNDILYLKTKGIAKVEFEIFDRFGKTVFETQKLDEGWDGTFDGGDNVNSDVYLYRLKATPYEKTVPPIDQAGEITLIR